jgi:DNA-binding IscR family transcriptional regulator
MKRDSRLSVALHVLLHMNDEHGSATSEALGSRMQTHPVVIRRTLAGLRRAGIVAAEKGHGGGWSLVGDLRSVTVGDVYEAIGKPAAFNLGFRDPKATCPIERAVNHAIREALGEAERLLLARLRAIPVADLLKKAARASGRRSRANAG